MSVTLLVESITMLVEKLLGMCARYVDIGQGPGVGWVVLADPEGNEFCVLPPRRG